MPGLQVTDPYRSPNIHMAPRGLPGLETTKYSDGSPRIPMAPRDLPGFQIAKYSYGSPSIPIAPRGLPGLQITKYSYGSSSIPMAPRGLPGLQITKYYYGSPAKVLSLLPFILFLLPFSVCTVCSAGVGRILLWQSVWLSLHGEAEGVASSLAAFWALLRVVIPSAPS